MRLIKIVLFYLFSSISSFGQDLIVFTAKNIENPVIKNFNKSILPQLGEIAKNTESNLKVIYLENGIPEEVRILPAIFYIDNNRKSIYKSAYGSSQRIKTFILQSKVFESNYEAFTKTNLFISNTNGFEQGLNLKITSLEGLKAFKNDSVKNIITTGLINGFNSFQFKDSHQFKNWNKQFFLNIYPYQAEDGTFYLSHEVFSQNNCHKPVLEISKEPISTDDLIDGAEKLAKKIESNWTYILEDTIHQDGLFIIPETRTIKSWAALGYEFKFNEKITKEVNQQLPQGSFQMENERLIIFTFAPPADAYSGIISDFDGQFKFTNGHLKGNYTAFLKSLDSGDEDLNNSIIDDQFNIIKYPICKLSFDTEIGEVSFNEPLLIPAKLDFIGQEKEVELQVTFSSGDNNINFWVNSNFILNISSYKALERPHFPSPINEEVHIHITFKAHNLVH